MTTFTPGMVRLVSATFVTAMTLCPMSEVNALCFSLLSEFEYKGGYNAEAQSFQSVDANIDFSDVCNEDQHISCLVVPQYPCYIGTDRRGGISTHTVLDVCVFENQPVYGKPSTVDRRLPYY